MPRCDPGPLTRSALTEYFEHAFTPRERWLVGMELEKMGRDASNGRPIPYEGADASVRSVLERYREARGGDPVFEGDHLIGIDGPWGTISLEPAGQVEWSSKPTARLADLGDALDRHLETLDAVGRACGVRWLDVAVDPVHTAADMPWVPKARYGIMRPYMGARGRLAHRMMTQTASIQCAFDFSDSTDWSRKFRAAALLAPVAVALFANSSRVDGKDSGFRSYRQAIWRETDPDRTGLPDVVFRPGFDIEDWIDWVVDVPMMFLRRARGLVPTGGVPFRRLMDRVGCDALGIVDWELHLSGIFTEVRSYGYIEVRSADLVPDPLAKAVPALWTGLLYDAGALDAALDLGAAIDDPGRWREAMDSASRRGLDGEAAGRPLRQFAVEAIQIAVRGLGDRHPRTPLLRLASERGLAL